MQRGSEGLQLGAHGAVAHHQQMGVGGGFLAGHPRDDAVNAMPVAHKAGKAEHQFALQAQAGFGFLRGGRSCKMDLVDAVGNDGNALGGQWGLEGIWGHGLRMLKRRT